ncbi:mitosis protein dim1 [Stemphylium lycopersici]|uniref:Mitosis protein dim1 n=1 Tax=Stemphylium lycopersici TaxID=183478 RepID=A0A364ND53_STELY|nr:mitosis protein dim1 [Stemphylium lycopersici]
MGHTFMSVASSVFKKLHWKDNPYEKSYRAHDCATGTEQPIKQPQTPHQSTDLLAEARQAAGRDRVTGRLRANVPGETYSERRPEGDALKAAAADQKAAYLAWAAQKPHERGVPYASYEAFVQDMVAKRNGTRDIAWHVDQAILSEDERIICLRFGNDANPECMDMDEKLYKIADAVKDWAVIYVVDNEQIPDFNAMYEIYDACTVMFFWRNKHMQVDFGTGNNNKINFAIGAKQELIDILEAVYRGASKGKGLVVSPRDYSTKWAY